MMTIKVHPAALAFPMLSDQELVELAADITANGLKFPIMLTADGEMLVDGRNRRRACELAGIKPHFERLPEGVDPVAHILSSNITRRHLTKGQQAIALAMLYPEPGKGGRGRKNVSDLEGFPSGRLSDARQIVRYPDLATEVRDGGMAFDVALREAHRRTEMANSAEASMVQLRNDAPDLAALVDEERMPLPEAWAIREKRQAAAEAAERRKREIGLEYLKAKYSLDMRWREDAELRQAIDWRMGDRQLRQEVFEEFQIIGPLKTAKAGSEEFYQWLERVARARGHP